MSKTVTVEVPDDTYAEMQRQARVEGTTPEGWLSTRVVKLVMPRDERLRRHFGSIDMGKPLFRDNDDIDAALAEDYGDTHDAGR